LQTEHMPAQLTSLYKIPTGVWKPLPYLDNNTYCAYIQTNHKHCLPSCSWANNNFQVDNATSRIRQTTKPTDLISNPEKKIQVHDVPWKLTQTTTPSGPFSNPLKKSAISASEALKGSPRSLTTLLRFLNAPKQTQKKASLKSRGLWGSKNTRKR
jgi:hypothetical protein